jgi:hypothetical protein
MANTSSLIALFMGTNVDFFPPPPATANANPYTTANPLAPEFHPIASARTPLPTLAWFFGDMRFVK